MPLALWLSAGLGHAVAREEATMSDDAVMAYAARFPGKPGFGAVCVDKPEYAKDTAKSIAGWIKQGATIERVTIQAARDGMGEYLAARMNEPAQASLL